MIGVAGQPAGQLIHASTVAVERRAVMILGAAGAGKSALALELMALGADLVADDQSLLWLRNDRLMARAPAPIFGQIEARGLGILRAAAVSEAEVVLAVDLDQDETERLPPQRHTVLLDRPIPLVLRVRRRHFASAVLQYLKAGRVA